MGSDGCAGLALNGAGAGASISTINGIVAAPEPCTLRWLGLVALACWFCAVGRAVVKLIMKAAFAASLGQAKTGGAGR